MKAKEYINLDGVVRMKHVRFGEKAGAFMEQGKVDEAMQNYLFVEGMIYLWDHPNKMIIQLPINLFNN